jgi:DNA-binding protein H-NS
LAEGKTLDELAVNSEASPKPATPARKKSFVPKVKYRDEAGNTWTGRGSRPRWLGAALLSGRSIDEFVV